MTLDTRVYVLSQIDYRALFVKCNQLIGAHEGIVFTDEPVPTWSKGERIRGPEDGDWFVWNKPGQGLCALMDVHYRKDAALRAAGQHKDWCQEDEDDEPCDGSGYCTPCWAEVSFDTAYGYRGDSGEGCGDLHARLVAELGQWLDSKGVRWKWQNEFTGEIHWGYEGLAELGSGGAEASGWYRNIVAPAIAAHMALESGGAS